MTELSVVDWYVTLLGSGPGAALYAQLLSDGHEVTLDFAAPIPASVDSGLSGLPSTRVHLTLGGPDELRAPMNGLLWHIPETADFTAERKARWPRLTQLDGDEFSPLRLATGDLVLEVWASAFRRMEQVFASLEAPTLESAEHPPARPAARWFVVRNVPDAAVRAATEALVAAQFGAITPPSLDTFHSGDVPIFVAAGDVLAALEGDEELQVAAFDSSGVVLDPVHVFATFARLAADPNFFDLARPDKDDAKRCSSPPPRHVLVFSDHRGRPYQPWRDFDDPDGTPPP